MNKFLVFVALLGMVATAFAQKTPPHMARRFRFFGADGGSLVQLSIRNDVQKELKVSDEQKTKIADLDHRMQSQIIDKMTEMSKDDKLTPNEMRGGISAIGEKFAVELADVLTADQKKRLLEVLLQQVGYLAVQREDIQDKLGLSEPQRSQVKQAQHDATARLDKIRERMMKEEMSPEERKKISDANIEAHKAAIAAALTDEQRAKFKEMQGAPFEFEKDA